MEIQQGSSDGGGGGDPALPFNAIQYNNAGAFGGDADFIRDITDATNRYGMYVGAVSGATNNWNIYSGTDRASFNANLSEYWDSASNFFGLKSTSKYVALSFLTENDQTNSNPVAVGLYGAGNTTETVGNTMSLSIGIEGDAWHTGAGTVTDAEGVSAGVFQRAGVITNAHAFHAYSASVSGGTITNNYGLKVDSQTAGTNNWNIWSGTDKASTYDPYGVLVGAQNVFSTSGDFSSFSTPAKVGLLNVLTNTGATGNAAAMQFVTQTSGTGGGTILGGIAGYVFHHGSGNVGDAAGVDTYSETANGGGDITTAVNLQSNGFGASDGGVITNAIGLRVIDGFTATGGSITNLYGIQIQDQTAGGTNYAIYTGLGSVSLGDNLTMRDKDIVFGTATGTKIGTATTQKLAFYNSTPIVKPTGDVATALSNLGLVGTPTIVATTNANLTGPITSVGNATAVAAQTGTGSVFAMQASPTFTTSITDPLVIGGTGTTSTLTLRSTSGVGTTNADIIFQTGNNGGTEIMRALNAGGLIIGGTVPHTGAFSLEVVKNGTSQAMFHR